MNLSFPLLQNTHNQSRAIILPCKSNFVFHTSLLIAIAFAIISSLAYTNRASASASRAEGTPGAPILISPATGITSTGATSPPLGLPTLRWEKTPGAKQYTIEVSASAGFAEPVIATVTHATSYTPIIALPDGEYYWRVKARETLEWGPYSEIRSFVKDWSDNGNIVPLLLSPEANSERIAFNNKDFSWTPVAGAGSYLLEIATDETFSTPEYTGVTVRNQHTPTERLENNVYYWRVTPIDHQGNFGRPSEIRSFKFFWNVAPKLLGPETGLETPFLPKFEWTAVEGAKEYRMDLATDKEFSSIIGTCVCYNTDFIPTQNLENDNEYYWRVKAVDQQGVSSPWSETRRFRMKWNFHPQLLTPRRNAIEQSTPFFSWEPVPGAEKYQVQVDESTSFKNPLMDIKSFNATTSAFVKNKDRTIHLDRDYFWRVRAIGAHNILEQDENYTTPWSETRSFRFGIETSSNYIYPLHYYPPDEENLASPRDLTIAWPLFVWDTAHAWTSSVLTSTVRPDYYELTVSESPSLTPVNFTIQTSGIGAAPTLANPFTNLQDGHLYYWRSRAIHNGEQIGTDSVWVTRIDRTVPQLASTDKIELIYPADAAEAVESAPVLGWMPVNGAASYRVQISRDAAFTKIVDEAEALFVNYVPWQGRTEQIPYGTFWWRIRAQDASRTPFGDWSEVRHFNVSLDLATGNIHDFAPPAFPNSILTPTLALFPPPINLTVDYSPTLTYLESSNEISTDQYWLGDLHMMLNRVRLKADDYPASFDNYSWIIAFEASETLIDPIISYGIYIDIDHVSGSGAGADPRGKSIVADSLYLPEYVLYIDRSRDGMDPIDPAQIQLYRWNGTSWNPAQTLASEGGDAWYSENDNVVQLVIPYNAIGAGDENFSGSLALTVFSTIRDGSSGISMSIPKQSGIIDSPLFVTDMLMPLFPFNTPLSNPITHYDMPPMRWRMPYFDSVDGYQVQVARDTKFTDIVETWDFQEADSSSWFGWLPNIFQSTEAYEDNESYYWRVRIRHERYVPFDASQFDYGPWSQPQRFKLASRTVLEPTLDNDEQAGVLPNFNWGRMDGAAGYVVQIDDDVNFGKPEVELPVAATSLLSLDAIWDGTWYWRVATRRSDKVRGVWTEPMTFEKRSTSPVPVSPIEDVVLNEQPTFKWNTVLAPLGDSPRVSAPQYQLQVDDDPNFSSPQTYKTQSTAYTPKPTKFGKTESLADGQWYWRVAVIDSAGNVGTYSEIQSFYKEYIPPTTIAPTQGEIFLSVPSFEWSPMLEAAYYEIEIDADPGFSSSFGRPIVSDKTDSTRYTPSKKLPAGELYWRVRMIDIDRHPGPYIEGKISIKESVSKIFLPVIHK